MSQAPATTKSLLSASQKEAFLKSVKEFCKEPYSEHDGTHEHYSEFDHKRMQALPNIASLITEFLSKEIDLKTFKEKSEILCRKYPLWGFKNFSGQMQLNQYTNNIEDAKKDDRLRGYMQVPKNETEAKVKFDQFAYYLSLYAFLFLGNTVSPSMAHLLWLIQKITFGYGLRARCDLFTWGRICCLCSNHEKFSICDI